MVCHKDDKSPFDKHKVFVRNINENDTSLLSEQFGELCKEFFFFRNKNKATLTKSAICKFRSENEAKDFIEKYNNTNQFSSKIKCEFALKQKTSDKKIYTIANNNKQINYKNSLKLYTNVDIDKITLINYIRDIFYINKKSILTYFNGDNNLEKHDKTVNKKETYNYLEKSDDDAGNGDGNGDDIIIVTDKKCMEFEQLVLNVKKEQNVSKYVIKELNKADSVEGNRKNKNDDSTDINNDKNKNKHSKNKNENKQSKNKNDTITVSSNTINDYFVYVVEFLNLGIAVEFSKYINKENFTDFIKNKVPEIKSHILFHHEICYINIANKIVFIKNLHRTCHIENITKFFKHIEKSVKVIIPKKNDKKQGYAIVFFSNYSNAQKALRLNGTKLCGQSVTIQVDEKLTKLTSLNKSSVKKDNIKNVKKENGVTGTIKENVISEKIDKLSDSDRATSSDGDGSDGDDANSDGATGSNFDGTSQVSNEENIFPKNNKKSYDNKSDTITPRRNDASDGQTLFITNMPTETSDEEIKEYVVKNISKHYIYIKACRNNDKALSVFVKLRYKTDADNFLKKIGEYEEDENDNNNENNENVIDSYYNKKQNKEKFKQILIKGDNKIIQSDILFYKNNYLMIKRAVNKDEIKDKKKMISKEKKKKEKKINNNIHLINDNNINNKHLSDQIIKRNNKLMEKKKDILKNRNFVINPCRIYIRNYPIQLEKNVFRQMVLKYFTPIIIEKEKLKKKEAFKIANTIIKKMKILTNSVKNSEMIENFEDKKEKKSNKALICFIDVDKHEHAKMLINLLQNKNLMELVNKILYKGTIKTTQKNKYITYVDYCIEDMRKVHIKKIKEEKFLNLIKEKHGIIPTQKHIKKKKKINKISRGKKQREKRRLLRMQKENKNNVYMFHQVPLKKDNNNHINNDHTSHSTSNNMYTKVVNDPKHNISQNINKEHITSLKNEKKTIRKNKKSADPENFSNKKRKTIQNKVLDSKEIDAIKKDVKKFMKNIVP
ncbi:RNA-binding protein, putative [Hepatocystis sp. ex Piliocolobus tephrosceles]|nr:RNA-binding protein, putative [Hepatocystis sp. ex Piliocolobus tephrosceles]